MVDGLQLYAIFPKSATPAEMASQLPGDFTTEQFQALCRISEELWSLMESDPFPPECQVCGEPLPRLEPTLFRQSSGRPRRYCSDTCRQTAWRERQAAAEGAEDQAKLRPIVATIPAPALRRKTSTKSAPLKGELSDGSYRDFLRLVDHHPDMTRVENLSALRDLSGAAVRRPGSCSHEGHAVPQGHAWALTAPGRKYLDKASPADAGRSR